MTTLVIILLIGNIVQACVYWQAHARLYIRIKLAQAADLAPGVEFRHQCWILRLEGAWFKPGNCTFKISASVLVGNPESLAAQFGKLTNRICVFTGDYDLGHQRFDIFEVRR